MQKTDVTSAFSIGIRGLLLTVFSIMPAVADAAGYYPGDVVFHDWDVLRYYYYYFIIHFSDYPFVVKAAFFIVLISALIMVVILIIGCIIHLQHRKYGRYKNRIIEKCGPDLIRLFVDPETATTEEIEKIVHRVESMKKKMKHWRGRIWVEYLVDLKTNNAIDTNTDIIDAQTGVIRMIWDAVDLDSYVEYVIHFLSVGRKIAILDASRFLGMEVPESLLSQLVNHKRTPLRLNARLTYMHSATHNTYRYLEEGRDIYYSTATGMELHELFKENVRLNREKPAFSAMIYKQSDVRMKAFLTIEKAFWGVFDHKFLSEMLRHPSVECRYGAIVACSIYKRPETEKDLVEMYEDQSETLKCEILKALFNINSGNQPYFFLSAYKHAISDMSRETALQCLWNYNDESRALFKQIEMQANEKGRKIFSHVKHPLIMDKFDYTFQFNHEKSA